MLGIVFLAFIGSASVLKIRPFATLLQKCKTLKNSIRCFYFCPEIVYWAMFEGKLFTSPKYRGLLFRDYHSQCDCANLPPRRKLTNQSINDFLSIRTFLVSYSQPIRLVRFGGKAVDRGLPKLKQTKARDSWFWLKRGQHVGTRMID